MGIKPGDRVKVKDKYFNPFNDLEGEVISYDECWQKYTVRIDYVEKLQVFDKKELKIIK